MPCMCGDTYCGSCGPAQGNNRCPNCGKWDLDGGCDDPNACEKACEEQGETEAKLYYTDLLMDQEANRQGLVLWEADFPPELMDKWNSMSMEELMAAVKEGKKEPQRDRKEPYVPPITVNCVQCGRFDETTVEFIDISEGMQGEDRLTFRCPTCKEVRTSNRLG